LLHRKRLSLPNGQKGAEYSCPDLRGGGGQKEKKLKKDCIGNMRGQDLKHANSTKRQKLQRRCVRKKPLSRDRILKEGAKDLGKELREEGYSPKGSNSGRKRSNPLSQVMKRGIGVA